MKFIPVFAFLVLVGACAPSQQTPEEAAPSGLTPFELEHGIGPVKQEVVLGDIDAQRVMLGKDIFDFKCSACHKVGERYIGPDLDGVAVRRSPTYVMNMILNPSGMTQEHPQAKALLAEFMAPMPFQNVTEEDARNILEYLRSVTSNP